MEIAKNICIEFNSDTKVDPALRTNVSQAYALLEMISPIFSRKIGEKSSAGVDLNDLEMGREETET